VVAVKHGDSTVGALAREAERHERHNRAERAPGFTQRVVGWSFEHGVGPVYDD
jgi:hypothetical protein